MSTLRNIEDSIANVKSWISPNENLLWFSPSDVVHYGLDKSDHTKHIVIRFDRSANKTEIFSWLKGGFMAEHQVFPFPFPEPIDLTR